MSEIKSIKPGRHELQPLHWSEFDVYAILLRCHRASPWREEGFTFRAGPVDYIGRHWEKRRTPPKYRVSAIVARNLGSVA